jgi:putative spermidine/putrescine transport system substrate-binding protein
MGKVTGYLIIIPILFSMFQKSVSGELNVIAWEGYANDEWVKPFEEKTHCYVKKRKYAGTSDEMVKLMTRGGYDVVSASGDATVRLMENDYVQSIEMARISNWKAFTPEFHSPPYNTESNIHYGVAYQWGPNVLLYNTTRYPNAPKSWSALYDPRNKGMITVPDNPIQIADAALFLSKFKTELGIQDPYELTQKQFDAVIALLKEQRPLVKKYWTLANEEIGLFKNGDTFIGAAWPLQTITLQSEKFPVAETIPEEGATGWADSWMISCNALNVDCAYQWIEYVSSPHVQAQQALAFGSIPVNPNACDEMEKLKPGSCSAYLEASYSKRIKFWRTPTKKCGDGRWKCVTYESWQIAWQKIKSRRVRP